MMFQFALTMIGIALIVPTVLYFGFRSERKW